MSSPPLFIYVPDPPVPGVPTVKRLNPAFEKYLREIAQSSVASRFFKDYVGEYPNPLDPDSPWGPLEPEPQTNSFQNQLTRELLLDRIASANEKDHESPGGALDK